MIGAVWFYYINQVQPNTGFDPLFDLTVVLMAFFGGYGTIAGPVLGALIIEPGTLWLNAQPQLSGISEVILGAVFLVVVLFVPRGILPVGGEWLTRLRTVLARGDDPPDPPRDPPGDDPPGDEK
jgi:branched-chain amino acid transport system permease protein